MYLIVGLGNPGKEYEHTKHNTGYIILDNIAKKLNIKINKKKFEGIYCKTEIENEQVILLKPTTYMNLSGNSIIQFVNYYNIDKKNVIVVYDDIDIEFGKIRIRREGTAGTHNGMKSVIQNLGTIEFPRIRVGIDNGYDANLMDYVLSNYTKEQLEQLDKISDYVYTTISNIIDNNIEKAMQAYN